VRCAIACLGCGIQFGPMWDSMRCDAGHNVVECGIDSMRCNVGFYAMVRGGARAMQVVQPRAAAALP